MPTVLDRLIQQAILQVLQGRWDPTFSEHSYGFRPSRSAHQAVAQAQSYVAEGYEFVVDIDGSSVFRCKTSQKAPSSPWQSGGSARSTSRSLRTPGSSPRSSDPTSSGLTSGRTSAW